MRAIRHAYATKAAGGHRPSIAIGILALFSAIVALAAAAFPYGLLKSSVEERLSRRFGRTVTIGAMRRVDSFGFDPVISLSDVRIPQPDWIGSGDLARVGTVRITFPALQLLAGRFKPRAVTISHVRLALVRTADGRANWTETRRRRGKGGRVLDSLTLTDAIVAYRDARQDRTILAHVSSDDRHGFRVAGTGSVRGVAVTVRASGPSIVEPSDKPWPFTASIAGDALSMSAKGVMDSALDTDAMTLDVTAKADDLKLIDAVIEAGLFRTRPVTLAAHLRREGDRWAITGLHGTIGTSDIAGSLSVARAEGRTKLDGDITSRLMDFTDLSSDEALAQGAALERAIGLRLVPNTRVNIAKIDTTDGTIRFRIANLRNGGKVGALRSARGVLVMDHQLLAVSPLAIGLTRGMITGRMTVDQRGGRRMPVVTIDLALRDSSVQALGGGGGTVTGRVDGRARLKGAGDTIRAAVGASSGTLGLVARDGALPAKIADALGFDAGRALFAGDEDRAGLRCVILHARMAGGRGTIDPLILDTTQSQMHGAGSISFPSEALAIRLTGAPKRDSILRLPGSATMTGTIREPDIVVPKQVKSIGNVFRAIGRAIKGTQGATATDADCDALAGMALR